MRQEVPPWLAGRSGFGPATKWLCIAILVCSSVFSLTQRHLGFGTADLRFTVDGLLSLELWRLMTYPLVVEEVWGALFSVIILYFFGRFFEFQWGSRDFVKFFFVSSMGAAIIALPLCYVMRLLMPFDDLGVATGPGAAFDAMLVSLAMTAPNSNILFGFVLPIRARTVVYIVIGMQLLFGSMTGAATLSITLGGLAMGFLLVTGLWRPSRLLARFRSRRERGGRRGLYVVPPPDDKTLH